MQYEQDTRQIEKSIEDFELKPMVPTEIALQLLRIQARYLDEHPCLCTSRFRHVLHQLDNDKKRQLAFVCDQLQRLTNISAEHLYTTSRSYKRLVSKIFDMTDILSKWDSAKKVSKAGLENDLEAVLARLVMCYRAIFIIDDEANCFRLNECTSTYQERKRHEDDQSDECPEEIKLMKVAWNDFSLGQYYSASNNEPVVAPKPTLGPVVDAGFDRGVAVHHRRHRGRQGHQRVKNHRSSRRPTSNAIVQEKGENSFKTLDTEFGCGKCSMERCQRSVSIENVAETCKRPVVFVCGTEDEESKESRASKLDHVLDSNMRALSPCSSISSVVDTNDNGNVGDEERANDAGDDENGDEDDDVVSVGTPSINAFLEKDIEPISWMPTNLREMCQMSPMLLSSDTDDDLKPVSAVNRHLDPSHMRVDTEVDRRRRRRLRNLKRQLGQVRKRLENLELNFENAQGYRPSHAEKSRRPDMKELMVEQHSLRKQIRSMKQSDDEDVREAINDMDDGVLSTSTSSGSDRRAGNNDEDENMAEESRSDAILKGVEDMEKVKKHMRNQRMLKSRPQHLHLMNRDQLADEKTDLKETLDRFQSAYGSRNQVEANEDEAGMVAKKVYERYRCVRRLIRQSSSGLSRDSDELVPIPENEELPLTLASPPHRMYVEIDGLTNVEEEDLAKNGENQWVQRLRNEDSLPSGVTSEWRTWSSLSSSSEDELWSSERVHAMNRLELLSAQRRMREFKRDLRRKLCTQEEDYRRINGRRLSKGERDENADQMHQAYKLIKARMKLVGALINKQTRNFDN